MTSKLFDFSYFPVLQTERFTLRKITTEDIEEVIAIFTDPDVLRYTIVEPPCDNREEALAFIQWLQEHMFDRHTGLRWGITFRDQQKLIGTCGFHIYTEHHRHADIGYELLPAYWGRGYMTEITHFMVRWCFENLNLHRIQGDCTAGNIGSERVMEKVGFKLEGIWRERDFEHGLFVDIKQYGLLRREYLPGE